MYRWDAENRLVRGMSYGATDRAGWRRVDWAYDALGRRIRQTSYVLSNGVWVVTEDLKFVSDPAWFGRHIAELNATNLALVRSYVWGLDLSETLDGAGGVGGLLWVRIASGPGVGTHFVTYDGNGNVWQLVSATTGTETARYEYGPFGELLRTTGPAAVSNPFRFSTKRTDTATGLVLYEYRVYSATRGRWISRDPIEERGDVNPYGFASNAPADEVDRLGLVSRGACLLRCTKVCERFRRLRDGRVPDGGIVCCGGVKHICTWAADVEPNPRVKDILRRCIWEHERIHLAKSRCPECDCGVTRVKDRYMGELCAEEVVAHTVSKVCYEAALPECGTDEDCAQKIRRRIQKAEHMIQVYEYYCTLYPSNRSKR